MGLAGEAGEVVDVLKKHLHHNHPLDVAKVTKELGDVLWYCAALASALEVDLGAVAQANIDKLRARYPDGFDPARSQQRAPTDQ
jgi:NTP pyrophosphatase (non-canonical NTP hydrolase)